LPDPHPFPTRRSSDLMGCSNHILCFNNSRDPHLELVEQAKTTNVSASAVDCRGLFDTRTVKTIRRIIKSQGIDVVHCHDYKTRRSEEHTSELQSRGQL